MSESRGRWLDASDRPTAWASDLSDALTRDSRRVFVCGPAPDHSELLAAVHGSASVYLEGHWPVVNMNDGRQITWAGGWVGAGTDPQLAARAWDLLQRCLQRTWRDGRVRLLATPATTGRDLWLRTLSTPVARLADCCCATGSWCFPCWLRSICGQGRVETMAQPQGQTGPVSAWVYDMRLAYLACTRGLPVGRPQLATVDQLAALGTYMPAKRYGSWRAPAGWDRAGILPAKAGAQGWCWPLEGQGWVDSAELWAAEQAGWTFTPENDSAGWSAVYWLERGDPLRTWQDRLLQALSDAQKAAPELAKISRSMVRSIVLHTIGSFHGTRHKITQTGETPSDDAQGVRWLGPDAPEQWAWTSYSTGAIWPATVHPEWSGAIWARARAKVLGSERQPGLLQVPAGAALAVRTDSVWTTQQMGWEASDDGKPGRWKLEQQLELPSWPRNGTDLIRAKRGAI